MHSAARWAKDLIAAVANPTTGVPAGARPDLQALICALDGLGMESRRLDAEIDSWAGEDATAPAEAFSGLAMLIATAMVAVGPPTAMFRRSCDFAPRLGLAQRQDSKGGKLRLGTTAKMGSDPRDVC